MNALFLRPENAAPLLHILIALLRRRVTREQLAACLLFDYRHFALPSLRVNTLPPPGARRL